MGGSSAAAERAVLATDGSSPGPAQGGTEIGAERRRGERPLLALDVAIGSRFLPNVCVRSVSCGATGALLLTNVCELWAWGVNAHGQLGFGDALPRRRAEPLPRPWAVDAPLGARDPVSVVCGEAHCVVATASGVYTAGEFYLFTVTFCNPTRKSC